MKLAADLTAWATVALAALALVTAVAALLAWRAQVAQIETLRGQPDNQTKERREAYVSRVFTSHKIEPL